MTEKTTTIEVDSVTCGSCVKRITSALESRDGVNSVALQRIANQKGLASVGHNALQSTPKSLIEALAVAGYVGRIVS